MGGYFINSTNTYSYYLRNTFNKVDYFIYFNNTYLLMLIGILKNVCTIIVHYKYTTIYVFLTNY